jgi:putative NADPH-quinone reductase
MNHLIVLAHPRPDSFTAALVKAYESEMEHVGHHVETRNLNSMQFDPVLNLFELAGEPFTEAKAESLRHAARRQFGAWLSFTPGISARLLKRRP